MRSKIQMTFDPRHTFVASDHHFGAYGLQGTAGLLRVFTQEEEETLIEKWNSVVASDDTVLYVGDFADNALIQYRKRLKGNIVLIKGNHDKLPDDVYALAFQGVHDELVLDEFNLMLRHNPDEVSDRGGRRLIYGHLHRGAVCPYLDDRSFCACVQFHDGYPVLLEKILESLAH